MNADPTAATAQSDEKRITPRKGVRFRCRFSSAGGKAHDAFMSDLSVGGAFIESPECPSADQTVKIQIVIGAREYSILGIVRHSGWFLQGFKNGNGFGVAFENLSGEAETFVRKVLAALSEPAPQKVKLEP